MSQDVYDLLGYDHSEKKVKLGALAENTHTQIKDKLSNLLKSHPEVIASLFPFLKEIYFIFNFLFHNSHDKFDRQIIVSNQINQIES